jgi:hypothetical protein
MTIRAQMTTKETLKKGKEGNEEGIKGKKWEKDG